MQSSATEPETFLSPLPNRINSRRVPRQNARAPGSARKKRPQIRPLHVRSRLEYPSDRPAGFNEFFKHTNGIIFVHNKPPEF